MSHRLRIVFMGTPAFAVPALEALIAGPDDVVGLVCQPDRPAGRGRRVQTPPTKVVAERRGIPVLQPVRLRAEEVLEELRKLRPDLIVVAAYGRILPRAMLELPRHGCINVHGSLLPRYRGAAPIQWAIYRGETKTGVTIMQMNERMDEGDILLQRDTPIGAKETYGELEARLAKLGAEALREALEMLKRGELRPAPQDDAEVTLAPLIQKAAGEIDWRRPAVEIERQVRAFNPWPSAWTRYDDHLLKVHAATVSAAGLEREPGTISIEDGAPVVACAESALRLDEVQLEGRRRMPGGEFARGARWRTGARLG